MLALMFKFNLEAIQQQHFPVFNLAYNYTWTGYIQLFNHKAMGCNVTCIIIIITIII